MSSAGVIAISPMCKESMMIPADFHSQESILIYVAMSGSMVPMRVLEYDSIDSVKLQIQTCKGFVVKNQKLVCGGRELARSNSLIRDYGVGDGNVLHLVLRLSDLQVINVKTSSGEEFTFNVDRSRDVGYVKRQIAKKKKGALGDIDEQEVLCNGERLEDQRLIHDICKNNDAVIHLFVRKSAKIRARPVEKNFELSIVAPQLNDDKATESSSGNEILDNKLSVPKEPPDRASILEPIIVNPKIEVPLVISDLIGSTLEGLDRGHYPIRSSEGTGGAYFMLDAAGIKYVSVFKPIDEEPMAVNNPRGLPLSVNGEGLKKGTRVGEGALRECAAYLLDHPKSGRRSFSGEALGFAGVPPTLFVRCLHSGFNHPDGITPKIGSLQSNSIAGQIVQPGADLLTEQNVRKDWKMSSSMSSASRNKTFDLELPAEEYVDIEDGEQCVEESPVQGPNILISEIQPQHSSKVNFVYPGDSSISNSTPRGTFLLFDLNEPIQPDETGCPNSALESMDVHEEISEMDQDLSGTGHAECSTLKKEGGGVSNLNPSDEVSSVERTLLQCNQTASSPPRFVDKSRNGNKTNKSLLVSPRKKIKEIPFAVQALPCFITNASLSKSPKSSVGNSNLTGMKSDLYNSSASSPTSGTSGSCLMKYGDNDPTSGQTHAVKLSKIPDSMNSVKGMDLNCTPSSDLSDDQFSAPTSNISHLNLPEGREREICEKYVLLDCIPSPDSALKSRKSTTNSSINSIKEETLLSPGHSEATMTSVDRDLEAPVSPENKECSPPRGDSLDNPIGTSAQWCKRDRMSDYTGETDRAAAETLLFISSSAVKARSKTLTGEPSEASHDSLGWLADIAASLASNLENEVGSRSRSRSSRPRKRNYQRVLQTEVLPAAASVPLRQLNEDLLAIEGLKLPANAASESGRCRKTLRKTSSRSRRWSHFGGRTGSLLHPHPSNDKHSVTERFWRDWGVTKGRQNGRRARSISSFC